ncbi:MAG TPA: serine--tRNA ligase [Acidimicrobiales bacterium]|nr:serine--tRNA ligase [Acidimicrobiales bacterium]
MIDLRRLGDDDYRAGIEKKGCEPALVEEVIGLDEGRRRLQGDVESLRATHRATSREIGAAAPPEREAKIAEAATMKTRLASLEQELRAAEDQLGQLVLDIPNPAHPSVPDREDQLLRQVGPTAGPPPLDHADLGEALGLIDVPRGAKVAGPRFAYLLREAVLVEFALVQWVMGRLVGEGFAPVVPPVLVKEQIMEQAAFFPADRAQVYGVGSAAPGDGGGEEDPELYLVGTAEVPLAGYHVDEILDEGGLPVRYAGFSTCFRREAGTYGKDTRGIFRVHQFDKVEMFSYAHPGRSWDEHEALLAVEEAIVADLGLPYRVMNMGAGDLAGAAAKKYDIEVWLPSEGRYREMTSCSNYTDYAARRARTRYRPAEGGGTRLVHTLNGTACAIGRTLLFLLEHYQDEDGAFVIPPVLRPYCHLDRVAPR